jgi:hypothetical protein
MAPHGDDDHYQPKDAISNGIKGALASGGAGLFMAAIRNSLAKDSVGAWGVITRGGGVITAFGMLMISFFFPAPPLAINC